MKFPELGETDLNEQMIRRKLIGFVRMKSQHNEARIMVFRMANQFMVYVEAYEKQGSNDWNLTFGRTMREVKEKAGELMENGYKVKTCKFVDEEKKLEEELLKDLTGRAI